MIKGMGIGNVTVTARTCVAQDAEEANNKLRTGDILVVRSTDLDMMDSIKRASALIVEEGGFTSHAAIVSLNLNIPVVVGAQNATEVFSDGQLVTLDSKKGIVYAGRSRVL